MDALHSLKNSYIKERETTTMRHHFTLRGFLSRLFKAEKYWNKLIAEERHLLELGTQTLSDIICRDPEAASELKTYQLVLKNINAKLTERGNFLLTLVTLITAFGLTRTTGILDWSDGFGSSIKLIASIESLAFLAIAGVVIIFAVSDALRVRNRIAIHEELINVIERYMQGTSTTAILPSPLPSPSPTPIAKPNGVGQHFIRMIFNQKTYSSLFKAGTVMIGVALIGMSQTSLTLYEKELDAYASKFKIEAVTHRPLQQTDCKFIGALEADCFTAQHKMETINSAGNLLATVVDTARTAGVFCFLASLFVFIFTALLRQPARRS